MKHKERDIPAAGRITLRVEQWEPVTDVRCVVVISHGAGEHIGRYAALAAQLVEELGALVIGPDHRGQGASGGKPGHVDSFDQYASDLAQVVAGLGDARPELEPSKVPYFLFAHSMGGLIALHGLVAGLLPTPWRGAILSGPLLRLAMPAPPLKVMLGKVAALVAPTFTLPSAIPPEFVSRDPAQVARFAADTRRARVVSARWFQAMNESRARVLQRVAELELPLLWYVGTGDKICDHTASLEAFAQLANPTGNDQTLRTFEGFYHELHNEPPAARAEVIEMIRDWIAERI